MIVAAPGHRLAGRTRDRPGRAGRRAVAGRPPGGRPDDHRGGCSSRATGSTPRTSSAYTSHAAAIAAAAAGEGLILALAHSVIDAIRRRSLVATRRPRARRSTRCGTPARCGLRPRAAGRAGAAAVRDDAGGDAGDVERARRHRFDAFAAGRARRPCGGRSPNRRSGRLIAAKQLQALAADDACARLGRPAGAVRIGLAARLRRRELVEHLAVDPPQSHRRERPLEEPADPAGAVPEDSSETLEPAPRGGQRSRLATNDESSSRSRSSPVDSSTRRR